MLQRFLAQKQSGSFKFCGNIKFCPTLDNNFVLLFAADFHPPAQTSSGSACNMIDDGSMTADSADEPLTA